MFTMVYKGLALWSCWMILAGMVSCTGSVRRQPNILFIMADDMGWNDVSFHGSDQIMTPNIDTLAYQGVILQQYYSEAICTPARTALLTGKYPMRLGMHGMPLYNSEDRGIPLTERLLPSYMKELGYSTHLVGKWHVGMSREEFLPMSRGYDSHYGMRGGFIDYYTYDKVETLLDGSLMFGMDMFDNYEPQTKEQRYIVDALTERAEKIIQSHNTSTPLFLHVAHNAPHAGNAGGALQPPLYSKVGNNHIANSDRRLYAEVVTHLDRSIGRLVKALADKDILEDTIIVFASDNGAPTVGSFNNWGINLPFRGKKQTPWEGGVRVPAFIWHSNLKPRVWNGLMHITDWLPTLISAAGGDLKKEIDGVNQWSSIVEDTDSRRREVLVAIEDSSTNMFGAYRAGDYKIVVGNVTGLSNGYYGQEFMAVKTVSQDYFASLQSCDVARTLHSSGYYLDREEVQATRRSTLIKKQDPMKDSSPCEPNINRGCLYNIRRDPTESHDLWDEANGIAVLLTSRLRALWAMQMKRGPITLSLEGNPALHNYIWAPWVDDTPYNTTHTTLETDRINKETDNLKVRSSDCLRSTIAAAVNCEGTLGIRNFLCVLRNIF